MAAETLRRVLIVPGASAPAGAGAPDALLIVMAATPPASFSHALMAADVLARVLIVSHFDAFSHAMAAMPPAWELADATVHSDAFSHALMATEVLG